MNIAMKFPAYIIAKIIQYSGHRQYSENHIADQNSIAKNAANLMIIRKRILMLILILSKVQNIERVAIAEKIRTKITRNKIFFMVSVFKIRRLLLCAEMDCPVFL
jgi:hypothetical protein